MPSIDTRTKYDSNGIYVARNSEVYEEDGAHAAFLMVGSRNGAATISTQEARDIAAALIAAADSFDALKPDPEVEFVAKLESLGLGAVVFSARKYVKDHNDKWVDANAQSWPSKSFMHDSTTILSEGVK